MTILNLIVADQLKNSNTTLKADQNGEKGCCIIDGSSKDLKECEKHSFEGNGYEGRGKEARAWFSQYQNYSKANDAFLSDKTDLVVAAPAGYTVRQCPP